MPFQVRAKLVRFLGDTEKYPCHMNYEIGDEIIFDGEKFSGRICPHIMAVLGAKMQAVFSAGPRYVDPGYYNLFWYAPISVKDLERKKYDGNGFAPVLEMPDEPPHTLAELVPPKAFEWPPQEERCVLTETTFICPDARTSGVFLVEADGLAEFGESAPYFRRQMTILDRLLKTPGTEIGGIGGLFTEDECLKIYPPLVGRMIPCIMEELELVGYVRMEDGKAYTTEQGAARLKRFYGDITQEERDALGIGERS